MRRKRLLTWRRRKLIKLLLQLRLRLQQRLNCRTPFSKLPTLKNKKFKFKLRHRHRLRLKLRPRLRLMLRPRPEQTQRRRWRYKLNRFQRLVLMEVPPIDSSLTLLRRTTKHRHQYQFTWRSLPMTARLRTWSNWIRTNTICSLLNRTRTR